MPETNSNPNSIYMGYTANELAVQLDVAKTIDNLPLYQQENAKMSAHAAAELACTRDISCGEDHIQKLDIFPSAIEHAPILLDIHGGGWRTGSKDLRSFPANTVTNAGITWVPIDYGLAPNYTIDQIVHHVRSALAWVYDNVRTHGGDPDRIYISGNSAGGHLTGCILMPGWHSDYGLPEDVVKGACAISGVFDLKALVYAEYGYNDDLTMNVETAHLYSPLFHLPRSGCPLLVSYGAQEPDEFRRQSHVFCEAWKEKGFSANEIIVEGAHHFSMARQMADPDSSLFKAVVEMVNM